MICSAQRTASAMALTVAGTRFPPSYRASFRATRIATAISRKRIASAFASVHGLCCDATEVFFADDGAVSRLRCRSKVARTVRLDRAATQPPHRSHCRHGFKYSAHRSAVVI